MRKFILIALLLIPSWAYCDSESTIGGKTGTAMIIQEEGVSLRPRPYLNFVGSGMTCADTSGKTVCTITATGGGGAGAIYIEEDNGSSASADTVDFQKGFDKSVSGTETDISLDFTELTAGTGISLGSTTIGFNSSANVTFASVNAALAPSSKTVDFTNATSVNLGSVSSTFLSNSGTAVFGGNVGIGTTGPSASLDIQNASNKLIYGKRTADLFDSIQHCVAPSTYTNDTLLAAPGSATDTGDVLNVVSDFLYLGKDTPFTDIYFDFYTIMDAGTSRRWEYSVPAYDTAVVTASLATTVLTVTDVTSGEIHIGDTFTSEAMLRTITAYGTGTGGTGTYTFTPTGGTVASGTITTNGTWKTLPITTDRTADWANDGVVSFSVPGDWTTATVNSVPNLYWVRVGTMSGTFVTEPTLRLCVPSDTVPTAMAEVYSGGNGIPDFIMDNKGRIGFGYLDPTTYKLRVLGTAYASIGWYGGLFSGSSGAFTGTITDTLSTSGYTQVGGLILNGPSGTDLLPSMNSPISRFSGQAWNGFSTKVNAMDIYNNPNADPITSGRLAFKNTTVDGYAEATEVAHITTDGNLNVLGMAQAQEDTFDRILHYVGSAYTDDTLACRTLGIATGDVLNVNTDYFYIGKRDTFESIYFDFDTIMSDGTTRTWEYWDGDSWETITTISDGTDSWNNDGTVTFTAPVDWATTTVGTTTAQCGPIYWVRVGTVSGTFTTEPTIRFCLPAARPDLFSNGEFDGSTGWETTGDFAYSTSDFTFTYSSGSGTLKQSTANLARAAKPNTWYRFRYVLGVAGPSTSKAWIGDEFSDGKTYFQTTSTTEVDVFFKTNSNPGDFIIYATDTATSGMRFDAVELLEMNSGNISATGVYTGGGRGSSGIKIDYLGNVGIGTTDPVVPLDVSGTAKATSFVSGSGTVDFTGATSVNLGVASATTLTGALVTSSTVHFENATETFLPTMTTFGVGGTASTTLSFNVSGTDSTMVANSGSIQFNANVIVAGTDTFSGIAFGATSTTPCATMPQGFNFNRLADGQPCWCDNASTAKTFYQGGTTTCF